MTLQKRDALQKWCVWVRGRTWAWAGHVEQGRGLLRTVLILRNPVGGPRECLGRALNWNTGSFWVCFCTDEKRLRIPGKTVEDKGEGHLYIWIITGGNFRYGFLEGNRGIQ